MSLTEEQKAFLVRKWKTYFLVQDVNKDGYLSTADYDEIAKRFVKFGKLDEKKGKEVAKALADVIANFGLKDRDDKLTLEQYLDFFVKFRENPRSKELMNATMSKMFDVVDLNGDGVISREEYRVVFQCFGVDESNAKPSFDGIDTNHDGVISKEEYLAAIIEYYFGLDETSGAVLLHGPLVD